MEKVNLYTLALGCTMGCGQYEILRVPGGWLYTRFYCDDLSSTFVPFNSEFQPEHSKTTITEWNPISGSGVKVW